MYIYMHVIFLSGSFCALFWLKKRSAQRRRHTLYVIVIYKYTYIQDICMYAYICICISSYFRAPFALSSGSRREVRNVDDTLYICNM